MPHAERLLPTTLLLATAVLLTACGAGSGGNTTDGSTGGSPSPATTSNGATGGNGATQLTAAEAKTLAAAAVLTETDLPGYQASPQSHTANDVRTEEVIRRCLGLPALHYLARNYGTGYTKGQVEVDSSADVAATPASARRELERTATSDGVRCYTKALRSAETGQVKIKRLSLRHVPIDVAGSDGAFAFRFAVTLSGNGQTVDVHGYDVGALAGPVEIDISTSGIGVAPATLDELRDLAATAVSRVNAAA